METWVVIVQEDEEQERLDKFIANKYEEFSRNQIKKMLDEEQILVNKKIEKASYKVKWGDILSIKVKDPELPDIVAEAIPLDVYYEDRDVIVVNKPSGMVVHPANGHYTGTLVNALMHHCQDLSGINGVARPGIVHRIDKDTSGLLIMAKNDQAHLFLAEQFKEKSTVREYFAICYGNIQVESGKIDAPIGRDPKDRLKMGIVPGGRHAVTHFEVLERFGDFTFIKCILETGRTHQIRVHMSYIGYPLAGDERYGPKKVIGEHGQFLHAKKLGFIHPKTLHYMEFEAPLPDYFEKFLRKLRVKVTNQ
jgi:23S rRNA pseudouridine1911/1915/1917 synthase